MRPVADWLGDESVPALLKARLRHRLQVYAMFRLPGVIATEAGAGAAPDKRTRGQIGRATIMANPGLYLQLVGRYYLAFWLPGLQDWVVTYHNARLPRFDNLRGLNELIPDAGSPRFDLGALNENIAKPGAAAHKRMIHRAFLPPFALLGVACLLLSLISWAAVAWAITRGRLGATSTTLVLTAGLLLLAQSNLLFIACVSHSGVRYLLAVFPLCALACCRWRCCLSGRPRHACGGPLNEKPKR